MEYIKKLSFSLFLNCTYEIPITLGITLSLEIIDVIYVCLINITTANKKYQQAIVFCFLSYQRDIFLVNNPMERGMYKIVQFIFLKQNILFGHSVLICVHPVS